MRFTLRAFMRNVRTFDPSATINKIPIPTPKQVKAARVTARMTQQACADALGYGLRGWQQKEEEAGKTHRALSLGEWYFLMLGNQHPTWVLQPKASAVKGTWCFLIGSSCS